MASELRYLSREVTAAREEYIKAHNYVKRVENLLKDDLARGDRKSMAAVKAARNAAGKAWRNYEAAIHSYADSRKRR